MKHLLKGLAFFVGFNAIITLGICWYNFLLGNGFNLQNLNTDFVESIIILLIVFGLILRIVVYAISVDDDN